MLKPEKLFPPRDYRLMVVLLLVGALLTCVSLFFVDLPVARWCYEHQEWPKPWKELRKLVMLLEIFGHFWGAALLLVALPILDPAMRPRWKRVLGIFLAIGLAPNIVKLSLARFRPRYFFTEDYQGLRDSFTDTFGAWFPLLESKSILQSFPSGHSTLAFGMAVVLTWLYPRGRWLFVTLAIAVLVQRVVSCAHFPSDTIVGAVLGTLLATLLLPAEKKSSLP